ncbi:precorrin-6y C5,15-methyltransferase (decarboxylating) subunit CbiE [Rhodopila sp.]|uniref:precorrin-6y C5,15-methyltransferase (decarboxylating) subunit CbiE n=1 Tax=Rhodopila sp. TaxID=2480087 RepID=UPI003D12E1FB
MSAARRWLSIVGIGEDGLDGLSPAARRLIAQAALVVGGRRHVSLVAGAVHGETLVWPSPPQAAFLAIVALRDASVCVVATGDPFFYGIGSLLAREVPPEEMICLPGASAFGLAASRLGWAVQDCALLTLHGRAIERVVPHLQPHARILALSWDQTTPHRLAELLVRHGFGDTRITVGEAMGGPRERLRSANADDFALDGIDPLNLVALELTAATRGRIIPLASGLPDAWFEHDGQLTKQDIRAMTLAALAPRQGDYLWDIGAGSGSVGIEWMLTCPANRAVAIERDAVRAGRIGRNAAALGVPDLSVVEGSAPGALRGLPPPDAVFIGGGASVGSTIDAAWAALTGGGRLVANGITIETQAELIGRFKTMGGSLKTIQIAHADPVGGFNAMRPAMAVTQWAVVKP